MLHRIRRTIASRVATVEFSVSSVQSFAHVWFPCWDRAALNSIRSLGSFIVIIVVLFSAVIDTLCKI